MRAGLTARTVFTAVAVTVACGAAFGFLWVSVGRQSAAGRVALGSERAVAVANALEKSAVDVESSERGYLLTGERSYLKPYERALATNDAQVALLEQLVRGDPTREDLAASVSLALDIYIHGWALPTVALGDGSLAAGRRQLATGEAAVLITNLRGRIAALVREEQRRSTAALADADGIATLARNLSIAGFVVIALMAFGYVIFLERLAVRPIRELVAAMGRVGHGELSTRLPEDAVAEIGELQQGFDAMAESLEQSRAELDAENRKVELLVGFSESLAAETEVDAATRAMLEGMANAVGAAVGALYARDDETGGLLRGAVFGAAAASFPAELSPDGSTAGPALTQRRVIETDADLLSALAPDLAGTLRHGLCVPLLQGPRLLGVVALARLTETRFTEQERDLVAHMADQSSVALANVTSFGRALRLASLNRTLIDSALDGIRLTGTDGEVLAENKRMTELATNLAGRPLAGSVWDDTAAIAERLTDPAAYLAGVAEIRARPDGATEHEFELAESGRVFKRFTQPVLDELGNQTGRIFVLREVTDERHLQRMKDEFVATVTHELRTPLTSIEGYAELLLDTETGPLNEDQRRFLHVIERNSERLLHLVSDLLFVARLEAGMLELQRGDVQLDELIANAVEAARPAAESQQLELELELGGVPVLSGDSARVGQLVDNLLSNAIKFTPPGGRVTLASGVKGGRAFVTVSDTGIGIPDEEKEQLFTRFFRATTATTNAIGGTGLGLAISKAIAEAHGGSIAVEDAPGGGTTFRIELPLPVVESSEAA